MSITVLWKMEWVKSGEAVPALGYVDFQIEGIDGVFRAANSNGVNFEDTLVKIQRNQDFFRYTCLNGISKVLEESKTEVNWGNGWEWQETCHPRQAKGFRLSDATSWFTCPFGSASPDVIQMDKLHNIQNSGLRLLFSWNEYRQPEEVCYFFPLSAVAGSAT